MFKILIVEDDLFLRELYCDILSSEPWQIEVAEDGNVGLEKMKTGGFDLVLLDMNLPKLNGLDIIKRLKLEPPTVPNKQTIFLTNMEEGPQLHEVTSLGYQYLIKSQLAPDQFIQYIKKYLQK